MKSMKEIADELNVTKMTVYNNAKKANVKFQKIDNVNYLSSEDEIIVINRIRKNQNKNDDFESEKKEEPNNDNLVKDETIKQLYNQIDIYKEQSNRDKEQINTLNRLLENQQVLALESNKKIKKLEDQLEEERQLNYSFDTSTNDRQNIDAQEATYTTDPVNINQYQEEEKETEIQHNDISESQSNERTQDEEAQKEDIPSNQNDNDIAKEEKSEETQPKKGFWSRLFGG
ncbi:DUF536 domain-containing protein [Staphylococcus saprophyticus]|uniref:DUF536 domain-containing protein n=1 Tax=Candidatus Coprosoma intestinipullorum TaxID=2840752 RepID=A0A9D0ZRV5_9FIRM|nr:DUF536 domain-containing protein [Staphylococcus saprophyticus]PTG46862.1 DUF536 domain-containing protein [Staphylococcus cohnii]HIQ90357.1 DUF536 domain-containing protein [Candidatus Coprosoma intestinipullorum]PTJ54764.1 DUF536 domain-containing protein [Staphylococcus saprophyticus]PTK01343.1 DUF536 domain-containing protein [Staphylococcus saprophyticus]RIL83470.1 DUF536 domain-containing protein [Staphylococcus cohnii]